MISQVRPWVRSRLNLLNYKEWHDGFNFENVPQTVSQTLYVLKLGKCTNRKTSVDNFEVNCPITVHLFLPPARDPKSLIDQATVVADTVINDLTFLPNGSTFGSGLKNVAFGILDIEPLSDSNDNGVLIKIDFNALVVIPTR